MSSTEIAIIRKAYPQPQVAHIINPRVLAEVGLTQTQFIYSAIESESQVIAVCGFQWTPSGPVENNRPVCDACKNIVDNI